MANRYWVGGTGTWNTTSTTNWSASPGGASGASVPTSADSVFFDQASTYVVTLTGAVACLDFTVSAGAVTFSSTGTLSVSGSFSILSNTVWAATGTVSFVSAAAGKTITTGGASLACGLIFGSAAGTGAWTLSDALTTTNATVGISITGGSLNTAGYTVTTASFATSGTVAKTVSLGNSTLNLSLGSFNALNLGGSAGTYNISDATFRFTGTNGGMNSSVALSAAGNLVFTNSGTHGITTASTWNNITIAGVTGASTTVTFAATTKITGALTVNGTGTGRVHVTSANSNVQQLVELAGTVSLTHADFSNLVVYGTAAPVSGNYIGDRGNVVGVVFNAPRTVYWNYNVSSDLSSNGWCSTSGGTPDADYFPLPQDTAVVDDNSATTGNLTVNAGLMYYPALDFTARTTAVTLVMTTSPLCYGSFKLSPAVTLSGTGGVNFAGSGTKGILCAGKTLNSVGVDTYGGTVVLLDSFFSSATLTVTTGVFDTQGYALTAVSLASTSTVAPRSIFLRNSIVTIGGAAGTPLNFAYCAAFKFYAGTSTFVVQHQVASTFTGAGYTFYNITFVLNTNPHVSTTLSGVSSLNNLTINATTGSSGGQTVVYLASDLLVTGVLACNGATPARRVSLLSGTVNTRRVVTARRLIAAHADFRDIAMVAPANDTTVSNCGDAGNNTGLTFASPKTCYFVGTGTSSWAYSGVWAATSGGTPDDAYFPLAQDAVIFDNASTATSVAILSGYHIGEFNAVARTNALSFLMGATPLVFFYKNWTWGSGCSITNSTTTAELRACGFNTTQTYTSNGALTDTILNVVNPTTKLMLGDALSLGQFYTAAYFAMQYGTFDSAGYSITASQIALQGSTFFTAKFGTSTISLTTTNTSPLSLSNTAMALDLTTATIALTNPAAVSKTLAVNSHHIGTVVIGGTGATSGATTAFSNPTSIGELITTRDASHTITFASASTHFIHKWSVTGSVGKVVTVNPGTAASTYTMNVLKVPQNINYVALNYCAMSTTSPAELYIGPNSTATGSTGAYFLAAPPAPRTLYWVGGTGNWSSTTKWSTSSGGTSGAAIPTSQDHVVFNSASSSGAYNPNLDAGVTIARCASLTVQAPATSTVAIVGAQPIAIHGNLTVDTSQQLTATNVYLCGDGNYTLSAAILPGNIVIFGQGCTWTLGRALALGGSLTVWSGAFNTGGYTFSATSLNALASSPVRRRSFSLGASSITLSSTSPANLIGSQNAAGLTTLDAGTSTINMTGTIGGVSARGLTFYNIVLSNNAATSFAFSALSNSSAAVTLNDLTLPSGGSVSHTLSLVGDVVINGTLNIPNSASAAARRLIAGSSGVRTRVTVNALSSNVQDVDFQDIEFAGAAAPFTGTRIGDAGNNSGVVTSAPKTCYWAAAGSGNFSAANWTDTAGAAAITDYFPLPQDTAVFPASKPAAGSTVTINDASAWLPSLDMTQRTTNTMTLACGSSQLSCFGDVKFGSGVTVTGTNGLLFRGRNTHTLISGGITLPVGVTEQSFTGTLVLGGAITCTNSITSAQGTLDFGNYSHTFTTFSSSSAGTRTLKFGEGTIFLSGTGNVLNLNKSSGVVNVVGKPNITLTDQSTTARSILNANFDYGKLVIGGTTGASTLTISASNNTFTEIASSRVAAHTIALGSNCVVTDRFAVNTTGTTYAIISGTSAASPGHLVLNSTKVSDGVNYLNVQSVRLFPTVGAWYIGGASVTSTGCLGLIRSSAPAPAVTYNGAFFNFF